MASRILKGPVLAWTVACVLLGGAARAQTWEIVEGTLGRPGIRSGEGIRFEFPRTDLNILVHGIPLEPRSLLVSRASFIPKGRKAELRAWVLVLDPEISRVTAQAGRYGLRLTTLDPPLPGTSPEIHRLFLIGQGPRKTLAWALKTVLGSTGTPLTLEAPTPQPTPKKDPWANVKGVLGPGSAVGRSLVYEWNPGDGKDLRVVLQKEGNDLMVWGEIQGLADGLDLWAQKIPKKGFQVTASIHPEDASFRWLDFWCLNDEKKAINDLTSLLQECGFKVDLSRS